MSKFQRSLAIILFFTLSINSFQCLFLQGQGQIRPKFDLEIERDPNTLKPKIMLLKEENKIAVKVRNNGPNSTKCEVGVRVTGGYSSLHPNGYTKFIGESFKVEVAAGTQTWVFIPINNPDVDLDEEITIGAWVANEVDIRENGEGIAFTDGSDTNPSNNDGTKDFFIDHKVSADSVGNANFVFMNPYKDKTTLVQLIILPLKPVPEGWSLGLRKLPNFELLTSGIFQIAVINLLPNEKFYGTLTIQTPEIAYEGQTINVKIVAMEIESNEIIYSKEVYAAYDNLSPQINSVNVSSIEGFLYAWLTSTDSSSAVEKGQIYYSTDDGETWSSKQMSYSFDMELVYDKLNVKIGPFSNGTEIKYYFQVKDGVGNWVITTPSDLMIEYEDVEYAKLNQKYTELQSLYNSLNASTNSLQKSLTDLETEFNSLKALNNQLIENYAGLYQILYISIGATAVIIVLSFLFLRSRIQTKPKT